MTPMVTLLVLGLLLVVALVLLLWSLLTVRAVALRRRTESASQGVREARPQPAHQRQRPAVPDAARRPNASARSSGRGAGDDDHPFHRGSGTVSNDDLRGAKAQREPKTVKDDDPFERFLRAGRDDDR